MNRLLLLTDGFIFGDLLKKELHMLHQWYICTFIQNSHAGLQKSGMAGKSGSEC